LRERATVSLRWFSARLEMGHYTNASRNSRKMNPDGLHPFQQAGAKLQLLDKNEVTKRMNSDSLMAGPFKKQNEPSSGVAHLLRHGLPAMSPEPAQRR
jgi:hypothetical protein